MVRSHVQSEAALQEPRVRRAPFAERNPRSHCVNYGCQYSLDVLGSSSFCGWRLAKSPRPGQRDISGWDYLLCRDYGECSSRSCSMPPEKDTQGDPYRCMAHSLFVACRAFACAWLRRSRRNHTNYCFLLRRSTSMRVSVAAMFRLTCCLPDLLLVRRLG